MGAVERRQSRRRPVALSAALNHREQSVICTLRDISLEGAFLDVEPDLLPCGSILELNFHLPRGAELDYVSVPATIQRTSEHGAAVRFGDVGRDAYFNLVDLIIDPTWASPGTV